jgi:hypothetical protein
VKIAIVEWYPRLCGAVTWSAHLAEGNPDVDLLSFSKSGKFLKPWSRVPGRWQARKYADAVDVLAEYDLVILGDIVSRAPQTKDGAYLDVVERLRTPFTAMIHDGSYMPKYTPAIERVLSAPAFTGALFTTRLPEARQRFDPHSHREINWISHPYLPWTPALADRRPIALRKPGVTFLGRAMPNKGWHAMLDAFRDLDLDVDGWGFASFSPATSYAYNFWECAISHLGLQPEDRFTGSNIPLCANPKLKHPDAHKYYTGEWAVRNRFGRVFRYRGHYDADRRIDFRFNTALSLTNNSLRGTLEYVSLDASAGGCLAIVPQHQIDYADYINVPTVPYEWLGWRPDGAWTKPDWNRMAIIHELEFYARATAGQDIAFQRRELEEKHDPTRVLDALVAGVAEYV